MRANEVKSGRYVAKCDGRITIVKVFARGKGWQYRDERTNRFVSVSTRRLWRPACDFESWDSPTVQGHCCAEHRAMWDGQDIALPVELLDDQPDLDRIESNIADRLRDRGRKSLRFILATAGC